MYTIDEAIALAIAHQGAGRPHDAVQLFRQVLEADPNNADAYYRLSGVLVQLGRLDEATQSLRRCQELAPRSDRVHNNLGCVLEQQGRLEEAETCFRRAIELNADYAMARCNLGNVLQKQARLDEAVYCYRQVLASNPAFTDVHFNLGQALQAQGSLDQAVAAYRRVLELEPDHVGALLNLGNVLREQRKSEEAIECCRRILKLAPTHAESLNNLALALQASGLFDEAVVRFREALKLKPDSAEIYSNLGNLLQMQGTLDEAVACCRRAVELNPEIAEAHNNLALALLATGRLEQGWPEYEWREPSIELTKTISQPRWIGSPIEGRTILLAGEQGLGDTLQFIRYASLVKQRDATVVVECQGQLVSLVSTCAGVDRAYTAGQARPDFDVYCPLLSLPAAFGTSLETIPSEVPYVFASAEAIARWNGELAGDERFKVGIAWQGSRVHKDDRFRSLPLSCFAGLARMPGVQLYSLKMGAGREQLTDAAGCDSIVDLADRLGDFYETAAAVSNLDLVITCDSAPAHLAGALGIPVWVALSTACDWRWMLGRSDSPWYPTMRLFRQTTLGDWGGVFRRIQDELARLV